MVRWNRSWAVGEWTCSIDGLLSYVQHRGIELQFTCPVKLHFKHFSSVFPFRVHKAINRIDLIQRGVIDVNGSFIFKVVARDHGIIPRSANITVEMNIVDAGDDSPVFNR